MAKVNENVETIGKVVVKYNGPAGYDIDYPKRGKTTIRPGESFGLRPSDPYELEALLQILKVINGGRINFRTRLSKPDAEGGRDAEKVYRFQIESGMENLPEVLQNHKFSTSNMLTETEEAAIMKICPKFFERPDMKKRAY